ncbi:zinc finger protein 142 isoform X1 [Hyalella azteca]|uniref:Zinc finger protein 142 isoform X1 n=2 Tax=Hyalella azteca TaxID=294128 RepID=A0A8B7N3N8_HYAAZ|nr:zinc finger protein 142 isoform X1 [Hyalella azteca]
MENTVVMLQSLVDAEDMRPFPDSYPMHPSHKNTEDIFPFLVRVKTRDLRSSCINPAISSEEVEEAEDENCVEEDELECIAMEEKTHNCPQDDKSNKRQIQLGSENEQLEQENSPLEIPPSTSCLTNKLSVFDDNLIEVASGARQIVQHMQCGSVETSHNHSNLYDEDDTSIIGVSAEALPVMAHPKVSKGQLLKNTKKVRNCRSPRVYDSGKDARPRKVGARTEFKCRFCVYTCLRKDALTAHLFSIHQYGGGLKCKFCDYVTTNSNHLKSHRFSKHDIGKTLQCDLCSYACPLMSLLKAHMFAKHAVGKGFNCKLCTYTSYRQSDLIAHQFHRHGIDNNAFQCESCDFTCPRKSILNAHMLSKHNVGKFFICDLCDIKYKTKINYEAHQFTKHGVGSGFQCSICNYSCGRKEKLELHQFSEHNIGNGFHCERCTYSCLKSNQLSAHQLSKHGLGRFK